MRGTLFSFRSPGSAHCRAHFKEPSSRSIVTPFFPPPAPRMAGRSRAGWEPQGRKEPGVGEFGDWAELACFACPANLLGHLLRPLGRSGCGTALRMTGRWHPVGSGGGGGVKAGSPRQGGAGGLKIAAAGFQLANVEAGSWRRGGGKPCLPTAQGCFPWVPGVSHRGAAEEVLAPRPWRRG